MTHIKLLSERAQEILWDVKQALQPAEEIGGPDDYEMLLAAIKVEIDHRLSRFYEAQEAHFEVGDVVHTPDGPGVVFGEKSGEFLVRHEGRAQERSYSPKALRQVVSGDESIRIDALRIVPESASLAASVLQGETQAALLELADRIEEADDKPIAIDVRAASLLRGLASTAH